MTTADKIMAEALRGAEPGNELGRLAQAIIDNTQGDLFWIGDILLSELEKETGYKHTPKSTG